MMASLEISRIIGVNGNAANGLVTIKILLKDGSEASLLVSAPVADGLLSPLHQTLRKMADIVRRGVLRPGEVSAFDIRTVHVGYDPQSRAAMIVFDHTLPSQAAFRLTDDQLDALERGTSEAVKDRREQRPERHH